LWLSSSTSTCVRSTPLDRPPGINVPLICLSTSSRPVVLCAAVVCCVCCCVVQPLFLSLFLSVPELFPCPPPSSSSSRLWTPGEGWNREAIWSGRLRMVEKGESLTLLLEDRDENGDGLCVSLVVHWRRGTRLRCSDIHQNGNDLCACVCVCVCVCCTPFFSVPHLSVSLLLSS